MVDTCSLNDLKILSFHKQFFKNVFDEVHETIRQQTQINNSCRWILTSDNLIMVRNQLNYRTSDVQCMARLSSQLYTT